PMMFGLATALDLAAEGRQADLLVANNVLAQVSDLNGFVEGMAAVLAPAGVITVEVPHLLRLLSENQFDTIYHEHFSYFSLRVVERIFAAHGLTGFDVEDLPTCGGWGRIYGRHTAENRRAVDGRVSRVVEREAGLEDLPRYALFGDRVHETKRRLLEFLIGVRREGKTIAGYGAPGKGNTLLNFCAIRTDFIDYTVDKNPYKQGKFLPGSRIPIFAPERIMQTRTDYLIILPWT